MGTAYPGADPPGSSKEGAGADVLEVPCSSLYGMIDLDVCKSFIVVSLLDE